MTAKEKAMQLVTNFYIEIYFDFKNSVEWKKPNDESTSERTKKDAKRCALIVVDENTKMLKQLLNDSVNIYQSLNTPKKLCVDLLNPLLKYWNEVKQEIEKL